MVDWLWRKTLLRVYFSLFRFCWNKNNIFLFIRHVFLLIQKQKSLRKRPSLDIGGTISASTTSLSPRTFIMEAPTQLCPLGATSPPLDRHLFLFSDLLLVGKSRGTNCFKLKESVRLTELWLSLPDGDDTGFLIGWPTPTGVANYLATYPTQAARDTWYR